MTINNKMLVVAPHPDDESLGCGATLLKRKSEGWKIGWLIITGISEDAGWSTEEVNQRDKEIEQVAEYIGFDQVFNLRLPTSMLDSIPMNDLVSKISEVFHAFSPKEVYLPHPSDIHTDHHIVFNAAAACTKWFRYPFIRRVLAYETLSETDFSLVRDNPFQPNCFVDVTEYIDRKLEILSLYKSEVGEFPFPRSSVALKALATLRGAASGYEAAEAFHLLRERL